MRVTAEHIKAGQHIFIAGVPRGLGKSVPLEVVILNGIVDDEYHTVQIIHAHDIDLTTRAGYCIPDKDGRFLYLGDLGVKPYAYDGRVTQAYTTAEEMAAAIDLWAGKNPNFIEGE